MFCSSIKPPSYLLAGKLTLVTTILIFALFDCSVVTAQDETDEKDVLSKSERLQKVAQKLTATQYQLKYKFKPGEVIYWQTEQVDSGEVSLRKKKEVTRSRTLSTKKWRVAEVDGQGHFTVVQTIVDMDLWQQINDAPAISYNSRIDSKPHLKFENVADTVGIELVNFKFDSRGHLLFKKANYSDVDLGVGGIIVEFPAEAISLNAKWYQPNVLKVALPNGKIKQIKIRRVFQLQSVEHDIASIGIKTQLLTPIHDPEVEVQIMHQVTEGTLRFDIKLGRVVSREFHWNRKVQGFSTADSLKRYVGRFKETLKTSAQVKLAFEATVRDSLNIRSINAEPIFRR